MCLTFRENDDTSSLNSCAMSRLTVFFLFFTERILPVSITGLKLQSGNRTLFQPICMVEYVNTIKPVKISSTEIFRPCCRVGRILV